MLTTILGLFIITLAQSQNIGFNQPSYTIDEGTSGEMVISIDENIDVHCLLHMQSEFGLRVLILQENLFFSPNNKAIEISVLALQNSIPCDSVEATILIDCDNDYQNTFNRKTAKIHIEDQSAGGKVCNDPHLMQNVRVFDEMSSNQTKAVCYDLYGKSGDQFEILSDKILNTSVIIHLRDDYYIGKVFVQGPFGVVEINTAYIETSSKSKFSWNNLKNFTLDKEHGPMLAINSNKNAINVKYDSGFRILSVLIVKIKEEYGKEHLNLLMSREMGQDNVFDQFHGGIFGEIANKQYTFYRPVQENESHAAVMINGRYVKSWIRKQEFNQKEKCFTLTLKDLLFPKSVKDFQKSS
ncbi:DgyrCDS9724 [Dimorphilus gyrociliatus]|uniref:DgyrCDS9724 n=1 Tax=Dimorphilus gyrociliatus TaxID=2664684 RepID=A0A7I8W346_9ANNE|nr:DgyrCDS9724 [Dimorphilus gyrociliatus]